MALLKNISQITFKLLSVFAVVLLLSACGKGTEHTITGRTCASKDDCAACKAQEKANDVKTKCTDISDSNCLSCSILNMIYNTVGENVVPMQSEFSKASMAIMMLGFSIWLALRLLKFVSSVTESNIAEVWNEILHKAFICLICGMLASSSGMITIFMNSIVFPVYYAFLELGLEILENALASPIDGEKATLFTVFGTDVNLTNVSLVCKLTNTVDSQNSTISAEAGFPIAIRNSMSCMVGALSHYLTIGGDIASTVIKHSSGFLPRLLGLLIMAFFWVVKIFFVFYLVDTIFQMGIIILLLPLFILSYAFGPTRKWATFGFAQVLASASFMMCFSIIVALVLTAMVSLVINNQNIFNPEDLEAHMSDISIGIMCMFCIGFLIYGSMGVAQQLTSSLINAKMSANFQKNLKAALQGAGEAAFKGLSSLLSWGVSIVPLESMGMVGRGIKHIQNARKKIQKVAGRDDD